MPFTTFFVAVDPGTAKHVYTAKQADVEVSIASLPIPGQSQSSTGYNFYVGGPELKDNPASGLFVMQSMWTTDVEYGDELWVGVEKQELAWTAAGIPLTVMVRSRRPVRKYVRKDKPADNKENSEVQEPA